MKIMKFKTNINCQNCVDAVSPALGGDKRISSWSVDTESPDKILTVEGENINTAEVAAKITAIGYKAEPVFIGGDPH